MWGAKETFWAGIFAPIIATLGVILEAAEHFGIDKRIEETLEMETKW